MNFNWDYVILNNTVRAWAIAFSIIVGSMLLLRLFKAIALVRFRKFSEKTTTHFDDFLVRLLQRSVMPLLYILAVYTGLQYLEFSAKTSRVIQVALLFVSTFFVLRIITSAIRYFFNRALEGKDKSLKREKQANGILMIFNLIIWAVGLLFLIDNLGYNITTIVTGLGIGGIAIALAAQTILGDLFSYLVIFFDKPFEIGDFIIVQDKMGTVEYIGIKTTRLRTLEGEQLVCSNTDLTNSRVHNYKRMEQRRVVFTFGVDYNVAPEKLERIPTMVKNIINAQKSIKLDRVHFKSFGQSSLDFEVVYYVMSADFNQYMDFQQSINFELFETFKKEDINFALPTRVVYMNNLETQENKNHFDKKVVRTETFHA